MMHVSQNENVIVYRLYVASIFQNVHREEVNGQMCSLGTRPF